jgi:hypothetical protein
MSNDPIGSYELIGEKQQIEPNCITVKLLLLNTMDSLLKQQHYTALAINSQ